MRGIVWFVSEEDEAGLFSIARGETLSIRRLAVSEKGRE